VVLSLASLPAISYAPAQNPRATFAKLHLAARLVGRFLAIQSPDKPGG